MPLTATHVARLASTRTPLTAVAKPNGAACNLNCSYCFFLSKELLSDSPRQRMSDQTLRTYLRNYLNSTPDGNVDIGWQGGEPTLRGLDFFRQAVAIAEEERRPGQILHHSMQTNGTLLTDEWGEFLASTGFLVGISIDGPASVHDAYRRNRADRGSYDMVMRGYEILQRYNIDTSVLCSVNNINAAHPLMVYRHLRDDLGATSIQFIPIVERAQSTTLAIAENGWVDPLGRRVLATQTGHEVTSRSVSAQAWGDFLIEIFDEWLAHDSDRVSIQHFDVMLGNRLGDYSLCVHAPTCGRLPAVLHNGEVYACDHFVEPAHRIGNIHHDSLASMVQSDQQRHFGQDKRSTLTLQCRTCPMLWACQGGCPKDRFITSRTGEKNHNYLCDGYFRFFSHAEPAISDAAARFYRHV